MFENFSPEDIQEVVEVNKLIVSHDDEPHEVSMKMLNEIFYYVNSFNDLSDQRERIIKKATYILAGISYNQPFMEGNRRTSYYLLKSFLGRNGFTLRFYNAMEKNLFSDLLRRTAEEKFEDDPSIYTEVEQYLNQKVEDVKFDYL
ncbi:MAG: Fic family protein [Nitrosopumilus sp.]|nr:Fic family protein [Nitrosopumilus sp.]